MVPLRPGGVAQYLGIPFAEAPIGPLRFNQPVDWSRPYPGGKWDAHDARSICVQPESAYQRPRQWIGAEDCLFLNVWAPANVTRAPVLFFIHGGELITGSGDEYNGSQLALKHRATVVTVNYRLNDLGWAFVAPRHANFGLKDQRSAMRWVRSHIGSLGGDARHVMIFGESSGAICVALHLLSAASAGLFDAAIMESGAALATGAPRAQLFANRYVALAGCGSAASDDTRLACLRSRTVEQLQNASAAVTASDARYYWDPSFAWDASVDGVEVRAHPFQMIASGALSHVPLLAGVNSDEGSAILLPAVPRPLNVSCFHICIRGPYMHT